MKTILVPVDFSPASNNAVHYAAEIASLTGSSLILFHAFHVPMVHSEVPLEMPSISVVENDAHDALKKIAEGLRARFGQGLDISEKCVCGFAVEEIEEYALSIKADLVVMGMRGAGMLTEKLVGSVTTSVIHRGKFPVLAIEEHVQFKAPKKIVLASDYIIKRNETLEPLKEFIRLFSPHVYVLNVVSNPDLAPTMNEAIGGVKLEHALEGANHSYHFSQNADVVKGIAEFISERKADMLVMMPHKHSFLKDLFVEGNTKRMAFHTSVPLLAVNE
jgi:nucleotide-binding universal stress UspA family protein